MRTAKGEKIMQKKFLRIKIQREILTITAGFSKLMFLLHTIDLHTRVVTQLPVTIKVFSKFLCKFLPVKVDTFEKVNFFTNDKGENFAKMKYTRR